MCCDVSKMVRWEDGNLPWEDKKEKAAEKPHRSSGKQSYKDLQPKKKVNRQLGKIQNRITENFIISYSPVPSSCLGQCSLDQFQLPPSNQNDQKKTVCAMFQPTWGCMYACIVYMYVYIYVYMYVCVYIHIRTYRDSRTKE